MVTDNTPKVSGNFSIAGQINPAEGAPTNPVTEPITPPTVPPVTTEPPTEPVVPATGDVTKLNNAGDLVDATGKVIKTKEELAKEGDSAKGGEEQVEEVKLSLSKEGDLVDAEGKVVYKKGSFKHDPTTNVIELPNEGVVPQLAEKFRKQGFALADEEGKPLEFDDSEDSYGLLAEQLAYESYQAKLEEEATKFPIISKLRKHIANGGDEQSFFAERAKVVDYTKVNVPSENKEGRIAIIREYLTKVANNDEDTTKLVINAIEDAGDVDKKYDVALGKLKAWQIETEKSEREAEQAAEKTEQERIVAHWTAVNNVINKGDLKGLEVPASEKQAFYDYVSSAVENGLSQRQLDYMKLTPEEQLQLDYFLFKKLNLDDLVKVKVRQGQVDLLKQRATKKVVVLTGSVNEEKVGSPSNLTVKGIR